MLFRELTNPPIHPDRLAIATAGQRVKWCELAGAIHQQFELVAKLIEEHFPQTPSSPNAVHPGLRVAFQFPATPAGVACLAALDRLGCDVFLLDENLDAGHAVDLATECSLDLLIREDQHLLAVEEKAADWQAIRIKKSGAGNKPEKTTVQASHTPTVTILTSGTEGKPKAATHTWTTLARPVRRMTAEQMNQGQQVWLLSFRVHLYAGLQVMLQALLNQGTIVMPAAGDSPDEIVNLMKDQNVSHASATPSYWRRLVLFSNRDNLASIPLSQITLGGEAADQQILDSLHDIFPAARIAHIYATTELGRCFSVTDGQAGFPMEYLDRPTSDSVELKIVEDQLFVRSANAMKGYDVASSEPKRFADGITESDWRATGDIVQVTGDRVIFTGRAGDMINVGGNKVRPLAVEKVVRAVEGVADCRIFAKSSSIAGQLVACEFVVADGCDPESLQAAIAAACRKSLQGFECPRFFVAVDALNLSAAGKIQRHESK